MVDFTVLVLSALVASSAAHDLQGSSGEFERLGGFIRTQILRVDCLEGNKHLLAWRAYIGSSSGTPVVHGDKILIGTNNERPRDPEVKDDRGVLMCFARENGIFLGQLTHARLRHRANDLPLLGICSRPCVDGKRAYYVSNSGELVCLDLEEFHGGKIQGTVNGGKHRDNNASKVIWKIDLVGKLRVFKRDAGDIGNPLPSPVVLGQLVYCVTGNGSIFGYAHDFPELPYVPKPDAPSFVAVDKISGRVVWSSAAPGKQIMYGQWSSPAGARFQGKTYVLFPGGDGCLYSFDPVSGRLIWTLDCNDDGSTEWGPNRRGTKVFFVGAPAVCGSIAYVSLNQDLESPFALRRSVYAIDLEPGAKGRQPVFKWRFDNKDFDGTFGTLAVEGDVVYILSTSGLLFALDRETGRELWRSNLGAPASRFGSPCVHGGKVFVATEDTLFVFSGGRQKKCLARYGFGGSFIQGTPAVEGNVVYLATSKYLYAIRLDN